MLQRFVELEDTVFSTLAILNVSLPTLSLEEWQLLKSLVIFWKPFETITGAVSGEQYMTASLVIVFAAGLHNILNDLINRK